MEDWGIIMEDNNKESKQIEPDDILNKAERDFIIDYQWLCRKHKKFLGYWTYCRETGYDIADINSEEELEEHIHEMCDEYGIDSDEIYCKPE